MWTNNYNGEQYIPYVTIDLDPGIYVFSRDRATGKTRLYKALLDVKRYKDVVAYTYEDTFDNKDLSNSVKTAKVIMFDRYDLYRNKFTDIICKYSDKAIILIDCKNTEDLDVGYDFCKIDMSIARITVTKMWGLSDEYTRSYENE